MAAPVLTALVANTWTKVAANVTSAKLNIANTVPHFYIYTYVLKDAAAPTDNDEAIQFKSNGEENLTFSAASDVYVKAVGGAGSVIVSV